MEEDVFQSTFDELKRLELVLDELRLSNAFHDEPLELLESCETFDEVKQFKLMTEKLRVNSDFYRFYSESVEFLQRCKLIFYKTSNAESDWCLKQCEGKLENLKYRYEVYKDYVDSSIRLKIASGCQFKLG